MTGEPNGLPGLAPRIDDLRQPPKTFLATARHPVAAGVRRYWRVEQRGAANVPARGPVIMVANHMGWLDGPLMAIVGPRPVHALTKLEMFHGPLGLLLRAAGQIPLERTATDLRAVRTGLRVLAGGGVVGMFPEGTRGDGGLRSVHGGAAYLALVTGAPVVPLVFLGTREYGGANSSFPHRGSRLVLTYGAPQTFPRAPWPRRPDQVRAVAEQQRQALLATLAEAQRATGLVLPGPIPDKPDEKDLP